MNNLDFEADVIGFNDRAHVIRGYVAAELRFGKGREWLDQEGVLDRSSAGGGAV